MKKIKIRLQSPTGLGRLTINPDPNFESSILYIDNGLQIEIFHIINISGSIIIYLNQDCFIQSVDFCIPKKVWKPNVEFLIPKVILEADIKVINTSKKHATFNAPVKTWTDENYNWVLFYWGTSLSVGDWVMLSDQVFGLIQNNYLMGFFIKLTQEPSS